MIEAFNNDMPYDRFIKMQLAGDLLADAPETINEHPYEDGWIYKLKLSDPEELKELMDAEAYADHCENEDH